MFLSTSESSDETAKVRRGTLTSLGKKFDDIKDSPQYDQKF